MSVAIRPARTWKIWAARFLPSVTEEVTEVPIYTGSSDSNKDSWIII